MKSHAGGFLNEMADKRAEKGRLPEAIPIYHGQNKYGTFQLRIKAWLRAQVAEDKLIVPLPRDEAPNKQILRQATRANLIQALKLLKTIFTQDVLLLNTIFTQDVPFDLSSAFYSMDLIVFYFSHFDFIGKLKIYLEMWLHCGITLFLISSLKLEIISCPKNIRDNLYTADTRISCF